MIKSTRDAFLRGVAKSGGFTRDQQGWIYYCKHAISLARIGPALLQKEIPKRVFKRVDQVGRYVNTVVKSEDGDTFYRTEGAAIAAVIKALTAEIIVEIEKLRAKGPALIADEEITDEMIDEAERPEPELDDAMLNASQTVGTGVPTPVDELNPKAGTLAVPTDPGFDMQDERTRAKLKSARKVRLYS